jgi:hypothetical protein
MAEGQRRRPSQGRGGPAGGAVAVARREGGPHTPAPAPAPPRAGQRVAAVAWHRRRAAAAANGVAGSCGLAPRRGSISWRHRRQTSRPRAGACLAASPSGGPARALGAGALARGAGEDLGVRVGADPWVARHVLQLHARRHVLDQELGRGGWDGRGGEGGGGGGHVGQGSRRASAAEGGGGGKTGAPAVRGIESGRRLHSTPCPRACARVCKAPRRDPHPADEVLGAVADEGGRGEHEVHAHDAAVGLEGAGGGEGGS